MLSGAGVCLEKSPSVFCLFGVVVALVQFFRVFYDDITRMLYYEVAAVFFVGAGAARELKCWWYRFFVLARLCVAFSRVVARSTWGISNARLRPRSAKDEGKKPDSLSPFFCLVRRIPIHHVIETTAR